MGKGYQPTMRDMAWARSIIAMIAEGGVWVFPAAGLPYQFGHEKKVITLLYDAASLTQHQCRMHARTKAVFAAEGYTVRES